MKLVQAYGLAALLVATAAAAENPNSSSRGAATPSKGSMVRPTQQVTANIARNPQSPGLPKALLRLQENAVKHQESGPNRVERPERALPPRVTDRPTPAAFGDRPVPQGLARNDRPLPPGLAARDRPLPRGHNR